DMGLVPKDEFAKKLINQGMITGTSAFVYRVDLLFHWEGPDKTKFKQPSLSNTIYISSGYYTKFEDLDNFVLKSDLSNHHKNEFVNGDGFTKRLASIIKDTVFFDILNDEKKTVLNGF